MSDLTITTAGTTEAAVAGSDGLKAAIITINPAVEIAAYGQHDVMFNATEVPKAVNKRGGISKLMGMTGINFDAEGVDMRLIFHKVSGINLGTVNAQISITDANLKLMKPIGQALVIGNDWIDINSSADSSATILSWGSSHADAQRPMLLQAEPSSTSIYVSAICNEATDYAATSDLQLSFHIEYL
jgi:hypothetical protein